MDMVELFKCRRSKMKKDMLRATALNIYDLTYAYLIIN